MPITSKRNELLDYIEPFQVGAGRLPDSTGLAHLQTLIENLTAESPAPDIGSAFPQLAGLWRCLFTNSRFVLGLNRLRVAQLSAVYQYIVIDVGTGKGHYFNIAEMSRNKKVRAACGEYAMIQPSGLDPDRLEVQYQWFYAAVRIWSSYEGARCLASRLENGHVPRKIRVAFHKAGWQRHGYMDEDLRIVYGSEGGIFVLVRESHNAA
jgi:hypothetical protein